MIKMLKNIKKIKLKCFLFPNLSVFIILVFQNEDLRICEIFFAIWLPKKLFATEKDLLIFIKNKKR